MLETSEQSDPQELLSKLANGTMPFGKYKDVPFIRLPAAYLVWFAQKGFPPGELGKMLALLHEIKSNGLEELLRPLKR